jgi:hypothetical protein
LNSAGPTELYALGVAPATVAFEGHPFIEIKIHMAERAGQRTLVAADAHFTLDVNIARIALLYRPYRADINTGRLFAKRAGNGNIVSFLAITHHPYTRKLG